MSVTKERPVAKKKPTANEPTDETKSERVIFLASEEWVERMSSTGKSLGLSLAAFIRMSCEEKDRRMRGLPDGN